MEYLTIQEVAALKGCSGSYISRIAKSGKIECLIETNASNNQPSYMIPISALPENLQAKYYSRLKQAVGTAPELKEASDLNRHKKPVKKRFEEYTAAEREEIALWCRILKEWQEVRAKYKRKTSVDADFVGKCRLEYGEELNISVDILYRKYAAFRANDYEGLIDKRGGWNRGQTSMNEDVWKMFTRIYLVSSQPTVSRCYTDVKAWVQTHYPELYSSIPSERTFRRRIKTEIPDCVIEYTRKGKKACFDKYCEYIERDYTDLQANEIWIADNHTLDVISLSQEGKPHRLSLTAFMDESGVIVGWNLCDHPCSQSTLLALRAAALNGYGIPWGVYFDNGSEFLTHDIAGRGHRTKKSWNSDETPPTILSLMGVTMVNALVKNAKAKNIERYFNTFKETISKAFSGYCGGTILERPEELSKKIKNGEIPTDEEIRKLLPVLINGGYNCKTYGGKEKKYKGMTRLDVWNESINSAEVMFRDADDADLILLMARTTRYQKIQRNGVFIEQYGKKIWFKNEETVFHVGKEVYVRYDPAELDTVRVFDRETDKAFSTLAEYFKIKDAKKELPDIFVPVDYVPTTISRMIYERLRNVHILGGCAVITGDAGIGKTKTIQKYAKDNRRKTVVITASVFNHSVSDVLYMLAAELGITDSSKRRIKAALFSKL